VADYVRKLRKLIGNMKVVMPGVRGIVVDEDGRVLLQKRGDFLSWGFPAGVVDVGDSALDALRREVREETGLTVLRAEPFGLYSGPQYSVTYPNGDQVQTFTVAFLVREWSGDLRADGREAVDVGFFSLDGLPTPLYPIHVETIEDYRRYDGSFIVK
jgi:8-oxo-dGTP pyrophosphatase MutT (NUDIX family)